MPGEARSQPWRLAALGAAAVLLAWWLALAARQVAEGGFYSDDYGVQWDWDRYGWWEAVETQTRVLGAKPILAFLLPSAYQLLGDSPAAHQALAVALALATALLFYLVLRALRFEGRDAGEVALLALLFPWASGVRLWPTGSLNNVAVLLLFGGLLVGLRALRVPGWKGVALHLPATLLLVASVLTYDATAFAAAMLWPTYVWLGGWRRAAPRAALDVAGVGAAALWTREHTHKHVADLGDQLAHVPHVARDGLDVIAATLLPLAPPAEMSPGVTVGVILGAAAVLAVAALRARRGAGPRAAEARRWAAIGCVAAAALAVCWAIYIPQAFYTPTFRGLEDRVNVLALFPACVLAWAVLRAAGALVARNGFALAAAAGAAIAVGFLVHDTAEQRDWARAAELQEPVLEAVESTSAPDDSLLLVFGAPGETAPGVPVLNQTWDLHPAAQILTGLNIHTFPVFAGAQLRCGPEMLAMQELPSPLYGELLVRQRSPSRSFPYGQVTFLDAAGGREERITSRAECERALRTFEPGPFRAG